MARSEAELKIWVDKAREIVKAGRQKDEQILAAAAARTATRKAGADKIEAMLMNTGRAKGKGAEAERKAAEETYLNEVSERTEQSANTSFVAEHAATEVMKPGGPPKGPLLITHADLLACPLPKQAEWQKQRDEYDAKLALKEKIDLAYAAHDPAAVQSRSAAIQRDRANQNLAALAAPDLAAATEKAIKEKLLLNELAHEIRAKVKHWDGQHPLVDRESRRDAVAELIEEVGAKYGYTNLAHFISRHGAERENPVTHEVKRTEIDFISRMATGVGPDKKQNLAEDYTGPVTGVAVPKYTHVGGETAPSASQHASAKAAMYMIESAMAEAALVNELFGTKKGTKLVVNVGEDDSSGGPEKLGNFNEPGRLGRQFKFQDGAAITPLEKANRGQALVEAEVRDRIDATVKVLNQEGARVTLMADKLLGGYSVMTMNSISANGAKTAYTAATAVNPNSSINFNKSAAAIDAQRKLKLRRTRDALLPQTTAAKLKLDTADVAVATAGAAVQSAALAVDQKIGNLPAEKRDLARALTDKMLAEVNAIESHAEIDKLVQQLEADSARRAKQKSDAEKTAIDALKAFEEAKGNLDKAVLAKQADVSALELAAEEAQFAFATARMDLDEIATDLQRFGKVVEDHESKRSAAAQLAADAGKQRADANTAAGLTGVQAGELNGLLGELQAKQQTLQKETVQRDTRKGVFEFLSNQHADAARQFDIATQGLDTVVQAEMEAELLATRRALAFKPADGETPDQYGKRIDVFEAEQHKKLDAYRAEVDEDLKQRALLAKALRDEALPGQAELAEADAARDAAVQRVTLRRDEWQDKAASLSQQLDRLKKEGAALETEHAALHATWFKGRAQNARMSELATLLLDNDERFAALAKKLDIARKNVAQLEVNRTTLTTEGIRGHAQIRQRAEKEANKPTERQQAMLKGEVAANQLDALRNASGKAHLDRAQAQVEALAAEMKASMPGATPLLVLKKEAAARKSEMLAAKARLEAGRLVEHELTMKRDKLHALSARVTLMVDSGTVAANAPHVLSLATHVANIDLAWSDARAEVLAAENAVSVAEPLYDSKKLELEKAI